MSSALIILLVAATPLLELRVAIPLGIFLYKLPPLVAFWLGVGGSTLVALPLLYFLDAVQHYLSHYLYGFNRFFAWLFSRTRERHQKTIERWGAVGLILFVAAPLPFTGVWTAALVAFLFGIPPQRAFFAIVGGAIISGLIITSLTIGTIAVLHL